MIYDEALRLKEANMHLLGQNFQDMCIEDIIIYPVGETMQLFLKNYIQDNDAEVALLPFISQDLSVAIVCDLYRVRTQRMLPWTDIKFVKGAILSK